MANSTELLTLATRHYEAGRLAEAEAGYRQVLATEPRNSYALHQLGSIAMDVGKFTQAVELLEAAVRALPTQAAYHANLGQACRQAGRPEEAERALRTALQLEPGLLPAQAMLGNLLQSQSRWTEAEHCFRQIVASDNSADALFDLGSVLQNQGKLDQAGDCYTQALALDPRHVPAHINIGIICKQRGRAEEAVEHFLAALALQPGNSTALTNLGSAYELAGRSGEALAAYRSAVVADPASAIARSNLGASLQSRGELVEARQHFDAALASDPRFLPSYFGLAAIAYQQGNLDGALGQLRQVLALDPSNAKAYQSMGLMYNEQGFRDEAVACCRQAIALNPRQPAANGNLAIALHLQGDIEEALVHYRREIEVNPTSSSQHSNLLYCLNFHPTHPATATFEEHRAWAAKHADPLTAGSRPHTNDRTPGRRLRIGYVSPYFYSHAVNFFVEPILALHDHARFEVFCYSDVAREDETTQRLKGYADHWRKILGQGHAEVSELIRSDQIDILVDLTGHIGENRMLLFAHKPAPVQVTYIGYQNTTGMRAMDYRLTDAYADPPGLTELLHTETLVRLPRTFFCYQPSADAPSGGNLPALTRGHVTFGSFNNFAKVTPDVIVTWAEILLAVPHAQLVVLADMSEQLRRHLQESFARHGVAAERLQLVHRLPRPKYLELITSVDIALDPFPFNGHTTTCDCLWQGVPVVTLSGQTYVSRFGGSGHKTLGLDALIARSRAEYREIAFGLATDLERLAELRRTLRERMAVSPLLDFAMFTRNLEAAYAQMWADWCVRQPQ